MNGWQVARQIKALLKARTWPDGNQELVFGDVLVTVGLTERGVGELRFPFVLISPLDSDLDEEEEELEEQRFKIMVTQRVAGDSWGEALLIGGSRTDQGSSDSRGLMELEAQLMAVLADLNQQDGVKIKVNTKGAGQAAESEELGYVGSREYRLTSWNSTFLSYPEPSRLVATDQTGGSVALAWENPASRYDTDSLVLRRAAGSTAPATVTDGTGVTVGALVESLVDSPGAGEFSYSIFMGYDEYENGSPDRYSEPHSVTVTVT